MLGRRAWPTPGVGGDGGDVAPSAEVSRHAAKARAYMFNPAAPGECRRYSGWLPGLWPTPRDDGSISAGADCLANETIGRCLTWATKVGVVFARSAFIGNRWPPSSPLIISAGVDRSKRPIQWTDLAEDRLRLDRLWLNRAGPLSSPDLRSFLARPRKCPVAALHFRCGPGG